MKATSFQKPFEYSLRVDGESWPQGEPITGTLEVKNHGGEIPAATPVKLALGHANLKDVRGKSVDAFELKATASDENWRLPASGQSASYPFRFELDRNAPVTDVSSSLFLVYGHGATHDQLGQIQVKVTPEPILAEFLETFRVQFRFVLKTQKAVKSGVDTKLVPPDAKQYTSLEHITLLAKFFDDVLRLRYTFHVKHSKPTLTNTVTVKSKIEFEQELPTALCRLASGRFNHDYFETRIREALAQLDPKKPA